MTTSLTTQGNPLLPFAGEDISTIALEVGMAILDMSLVLVDARTERLPDGVTACVHLTGDWEGSVVLEASPQLALDGTATMFDMPAQAIGDEEMADALGELANIVGGGIKGLLPGSCRLSLPTVALGSNSRLVFPGAELLHRIVLAAEDQQLVVTVWKRPTSAATRPPDLPEPAPSHQPENKNERRS
jgi:chemotaxis protein CheX